MNYEEFKENVVADFVGYLPQEFKESEVEIRKVPKVNGYLEAIHLKPLKTNMPMPTIYLIDLYNNYRQGEAYEVVLSQGASVFARGIKLAGEMVGNMKFIEDKANIVATLVNTSKNQELIAKAPSKTFMDLSVIYRIVAILPDKSVNGVIITNELAKKFNLTEEELYEIALENTIRLFPLAIQYLSEEFCLVSNKFGINGAAVMLYKDAFKGIAEKMNADLFILPSSIHEVIAIPARHHSYSELALMVNDANSTVVEDYEILSENVYFYSKEKGEIMLARDICLC